MIVNIQSLRTGIDWWLQNWSSEFVNDEYRQLYAARELGIDRVWWESTVKRLWDWKAIRAPKPPNTQKEIIETGLSFLDAIAAQYRRIREGSSAEPSIEELSWEDVAPLYGLALEIKNGSPVFACKMCHFLFPKLFLVIDNWATGMMDYDLCWRGIKEEWARFPAKDDARRELRHAIKSRYPLHELYPFETKIMELSLIGHYWRTKSEAKNEDGDSEVIVEISAEGGSVTLIGERSKDCWRFRLQVDDCASEFLDDEDAFGLPQGLRSSPWVHTWPAAIALLDCYPWEQLSAESVHPDFREQVWLEVNRQTNGSRHRADDSKARLEDWRRLCAIGG